VLSTILNTTICRALAHFDFALETGEPEPIESARILLATAVSGSPFLGLLGTVWGVMDAFTGVAEAGSPNLVAMAPGVSGALITTVTALCVAIPAMFGYNFLVTSIRGIIVKMDNFAAALGSVLEHKYVDHGSRESTFRR